MFLYWIPSDFLCTHKALFVYNLFHTTRTFFQPYLGSVSTVGISPYSDQTVIFYNTGQPPHPHHYIPWKLLIQLWLWQPFQGRHGSIPQPLQCTSTVLLNIVTSMFASMGRQKVRAIWQSDAIWMKLVIVLFILHS